MKEQAVEIKDMEHFKLAEGETLILRAKFPLPAAQVERLSEMAHRALPGRRVLVLDSAIEVMAGKAETDGQDQGQATPAPDGSQCGDEPSKPRNWIGRFVGWVTGRAATRATTNSWPGHWQPSATQARILAAIRDQQRLEKERAAAGTVTHMDGLHTLTLPRMEMTREMVVEDQRRAACMAAAHTPDNFQRLATQMLASIAQVQTMIEAQQRQAAHMAAGHSLTCTIDIERQAKEACDSLVEAFKAEQVRDELPRSQIVQDASIEAERADERSRS